MVGSIKSCVFLCASSTNSPYCNCRMRLSPSLSCKKLSANQKRISTFKCWSFESSENVSINNAQKPYHIKRSVIRGPNTKEIQSAQELVDTLKEAGDRLVVVSFYSPACGGCTTLHPKISQIAEANPDAIFLSVNYEQLKKMCNALHINVLPFFRFYKGSHGLVCRFSCTLSTIKKFKQALAKHSTDLHLELGGPTKGLDESEMMNLTSTGEITTIHDKQIQSSIIKYEGMENDLFTKTIQNPSQKSRWRLKRMIQCWLLRSL